MFVADEIHQIVVVIFHVGFDSQLTLVFNADITALIIENIDIGQPVAVSPKLPITGAGHLQHVLRLQKFPFAVAHFIGIGQKGSLIIIFFKQRLREQRGIIPPVFKGQVQRLVGQLLAMAVIIDDILLRNRRIALFV